MLGHVRTPAKRQVQTRVSHPRRALPPTCALCPCSGTSAWPCIAAQCSAVQPFSSAAEPHLLEAPAPPAVRVEQRARQRHLRGVDAAVPRAGAGGVAEAEGDGDALSGLPYSRCKLLLYVFADLCFAFAVYSYVSCPQQVCCPQQLSDKKTVIKQTVALN